MSVPPSSWSDILRQREYEKKNLPWDPASSPHIERVSLYEVRKLFDHLLERIRSFLSFDLQRKKVEREFNPVLVQYRDEERQSQLDRERTERFATTCKTTLRAKSEKFNIVSHEGPPRKLMTAPDVVHNKRRENNIVTNMFNKDHRRAPLIYDEQYVSAKSIRNKVSQVDMTSSNKFRDFNIVSNEFWANNEAKQAQICEETRASAMSKYWKTHDFDPLVGEYIDKTKELNYRNQRKAIAATQGTFSSLKLPPSLQVSEGSSYNLLNHSVFDEHRLKVTNTVSDRSLNRMNQRAVEARLVDESTREAELREELRMKRISFKRYQDQIDRGYNILDNSPSQEMRPFPERPVTMWMRLQSTSTASKSAEQLTDRLNTFRARDVSGRAKSGSGQLLNSPSPLLSNPHSPSSIRFPVHTGRSASDYVNPTSTRRQAANELRSVSSAVPSLDLSRAEAPEKVKYVEPTDGPMGMPIAMVRTGGMSSFR